MTFKGKCLRVLCVSSICETARPGLWPAAEVPGDFQIVLSVFMFSLYLCILSPQIPLEVYLVHTCV